jgi:hypothetical protein
MFDRMAVHLFELVQHGVHVGVGRMGSIAAAMQRIDDVANDRCHWGTYGMSTLRDGAERASPCIMPRAAISPSRPH